MYLERTEIAFSGAAASSEAFSLRLILSRAKEIVWRCCSSNTALHMQLHVLQL
jgi:hypothetical protein